jgi:hypothetical protein
LNRLGFSPSLKPPYGALPVFGQAGPEPSLPLEERP